MTKGNIIIYEKAYGEFRSRNIITIQIPVNFDFDDNASKELIYNSWALDKNLPIYYKEEREFIKQLRNLYKLQEFMLLKKSKITYISISIVADKEIKNTIYDNLTLIFGNKLKKL